MARKRSPAYPAVNLEKAVAQARKVYAEEHDNLAPVTAVLCHWKFGENSGTGMAQIAALKHYGLLEEKKTGKGRQVKLTDLALDIVLDDREASSSKAEALRQAALNPTLHAELWGKWAEKLPSQATARHFLVRERDFHPDYAGKAFGIYTDTIEFAKVQERGIIEEENEDDDPPPDPDEKRKKNLPPVDPATAIPVTIQEEDGSILMVNVPRMSKHAFVFFKKMLDTFEKSITKTTASDSKDQSAN